MSAPAFIHLRLHSEYSIADGTVRIDDAVAAAAADTMPALALTDLANAFGLVKFYQAARRRGVKPIFGCDVRITHDAATGAVGVIVDGESVPALQAVDLSLGTGKVGVGSFDASL